MKAERIAIMLLAAVYAANTAAELADMIGIITIHPPETRAVSLLSSSLAIWVTNVLTFSLLYWQIDRGGPGARMSNASTKPDWLFPQATAAELAPPDWRPIVPRLPVSWVQYGDRLQPHRCPAAHAPRQVADDGGEHNFTVDARHRRRPGDQCSALDRQCPVNGPLIGNETQD